MPSVLWRCWLGGRKGIQPVKSWLFMGAGVVICLERGADLHMAQLMPLPLTVSCFSKIQIGFTFLVPAHLGSHRQRAVKRARVCVCVALVCRQWNIALQQQCQMMFGIAQMINILAVLCAQREIIFGLVTGSSCHLTGVRYDMVRYIYICSKTDC